MEVQDILACSFPNWYPTFEEFTARSVCLPLSEEFVRYLREDGLFLPSGTETSSELISNRRSSSSSNDSWSESDSEADGKSKRAFPELSDRVSSAIAELGGSVFAKLNWSSPKDAAWIGLNRSLKCRTFGDVILLLKASDFVQHDLSQPFRNCGDASPTSQDFLAYHLVLRRWTDVNPASEFRCFVKNAKLVGICQRDTTTYYGHIIEHKAAIRTRLSKFFEEVIRDRFERPNYSFDMHFKDGLINPELLDFNPFGETTDSLLFGWDELNSGVFGASNGREWVPELRHVQPGQGMRSQEYSRYELPVDMVDLMTGTDPEKLMDLLTLHQREQLTCDDSDSSGTGDSPE